MNDYAEFARRMLSADSFVIASHYNPDGDGIGSCIALGHALEGAGKRVLLYNRDEIPENLRFLPKTDKFVRSLPDGERFDMAIMVDCGQRKRISDSFAAYPGFGTVACVDHHKMEGVEADMVLLDGEAASAGEVVMRLVKEAGLVVDLVLAQCIYTSLVVDTGFFRYSSTDAHTFALASELVEMGAEPWTVAKNLDESYPASRLNLLSRSLATLELDLDGRYARMEVTQRMLAESGASMEYSDEFATYPRSIRGVEVAALFREVAGGLIKVSLRSKDLVDVAELARGMKGGGHARAAGLRISASLDDAKKKIYDAAKEALKNSES